MEHIKTIAKKENFHEFIELPFIIGQDTGISETGQAFLPENSGIIYIKISFYEPYINSPEKVRTDLVLNLPNWSEEKLKSSQLQEKLTKILEEIWISGEIKDNQGLDFNLPFFREIPTNSNCDHCHKPIPPEKAWFSNREKDLDFCSEQCAKNANFDLKNLPDKEKDKYLENKVKQLEKSIKKTETIKVVFLMLLILSIVVNFCLILLYWKQKKSFSQKNR